MTSTLVLLMTLPGLAMFYAGLVRAKNVLSIMMQCVALAGLMSVLWLVAGYSLAFGEGNGWIGSLSKVLLSGVGRTQIIGTLPELTFFLFQMTFAIITPALIIGAVAERVHFGFFMLFCGLWLLLVYAPVTHWIWGGGWLAKLNVMDYAGGMVVHTTAGISSLILAIMIGKRPGFPKEIRPPHNPGMTMIGAGLLWVGWYGFNGGSALAANADAASAIVNTHIAASVAALVWMAIEWIKFKRPSLIGTVTGAVAGLATITPASGFIGPQGALLIGIFASLICFYAVDLVKHRLKIDDSLDVFAVHGVGGMTGSLLVALLAHPLAGGVGYANGVTPLSQSFTQIMGVMATLLWSGLATIMLIVILRKLMPTRAQADDIEMGLDLSSHGERGYNFN